MSGIKIINVLKDDTLAEILELFRQAPPGEVIFVLPKNGKIFRKEDHFSAFAAEAAGSGKTISVLTPNAELAALARKYKFNVMHAGKAGKEKAAAKEEPAAPSEAEAAILASVPPPADDDIQDTSEDAFQKDVVTTSDETMDVSSPETDEGSEPLEGFRVVDEAGESVDDDKDGNPDEPAQNDLVYGDAELTMARAAKKPVAETVPVTVETDYIDAVWRDKLSAQAPSADSIDGTPAAPVQTVRAATAAKRPPFWKRFSLKRPAMPSGRHVSRRVAAGILAASALLLAVVVWATTGSASVILTPVSHQLNAQMTVQASDVYTSVDASFNKIPGQLFEASRTATAEEPATGTRDVASKARGVLTIYNEYSSTPQTLVATTRFANPSGQVFRTLQSVTVPGSTVQEGKTVAGKISVDIIADKPGPDYNVAAGKWVIMAFQERGDAERVAKIYGQTDQAMSGGASGPSKVVTQSDYDKAVAHAQEQVRAQLKEAFDAQAAGMRVLEEAQPIWAELKTTARPDDAAEKVGVTAAGTLKTIAFRQADLEKLISEVILQKERLVVVPEQLELTFSDIVFKADIGTLVFSVNIKGPGYEPLDGVSIKNEIKGKGAAQIREYFASKDGVESATVTLSPFWVRSVPTRDSRINIEVKHVKPTPAP